MINRFPLAGIPVDEEDIFFREPDHEDDARPETEGTARPNPMQLYWQNKLLSLQP